MKFSKNEIGCTIKILTKKEQNEHGNAYKDISDYCGNVCGRKTIYAIENDNGDGYCRKCVNLEVLAEHNRDCKDELDCVDELERHAK